MKPRSTPETEVEQEEGLLHRIVVGHDVITGLTFMPALQCLCVVPSKLGTICLTALDGSPVYSLCIHTKDPRGAVTLQTKPNTVVVAGKDERLLNVVTLTRTVTSRIEVVGEALWKLPFEPCDIGSFKTNMLLILDGEQRKVHILTEEGQQLECIAVQDEIPRGLVPTVCAGTSKGLWVAMGNPHADSKSAVVRVNQYGSVGACYPGWKEPLPLTTTNVCEVSNGHVAIADIETNRVHLVNNDGVFQ